jgi:pyruvate dehydrogenase E2 component (dihydrolipoamide acetyltransferase)
MAQVVTMPKLGFDMAEGTLVRWVILEGEKVAKGAILAEIETDKATVEVESVYEGLLARHLVSSGEVVPVNTPIAVIAAEGEQVDYKALGVEVAEAKAPIGETKAEVIASKPSVASEAPKTEEIKEARKEGDGRMPGGIKASPLARRMAEEMGINLKKVPGSGPGGRVTKKDIRAFLASPEAPPAEAAPALPGPAISALPYAPAPASESAPLNRLRAAIGRRMTEAKQTVPHFYVTHEYDVEALLALRQKVNGLLAEEEKISVNDFVLKAAALTLREFPNLNASYQGDQILRHGAVNIGVAVAVEGGLLTVVCRDTDRKPLRQIAAEVKVMAARAREGKVRPDEIEGSTFSVSNLGMYDVEHFIAIINPPEAAILAVGSARQQPVVKDGEIVIGARMKATISVDHRVSDGAEAARFLQALAKYIEEPLRLML